MNSPDSFIRLSTDQFAEPDRVEAAREIFGREILKMEFEPLPDVPFGMDLTLRALPDFAVAHGICSAKSCISTPQLIDSDDLFLTVALSGAGVFQIQGRETRIGGGSAVLVRGADPFRFHIHSSSELVSFRLPLSRMASLITDLDTALAQPIAADTGALRLLVHYAGILQDEDALDSPKIRGLVATHLLDLAALAIGAKRDAGAVAGGRGVRAARLRAIKADIVENLTDRELSIDTTAARHGVTPRYVGMLFEGDATTFSDFVLSQRLSLVHRMLIDRRLSDRTVSSIALDAGFGDISYFNRAFRRRYGATPSDVRAQAPDGQQS
jgi:AraC-like DNA-binding protein